jgi:signal transduction histidine kinase
MKKDTKPYRILIVEDNTGDFVLAEDFLFEQILNPVIVQAVSFKQASEILLTTDTPFDIILLDLSLPDKNGNELIADMLKLASSCPIIILTGYTDIDFSIKSIGQGVLDYLIKDELNASLLYKSIIYSIEIKKHILELKESDKKVTRAIIKTQEDERQEIGSELHDNVCQILLVSKLNLGMLKESLPPEGIQFFDKCNEYISSALNETRNLSHRLSPLFFDDSTMEETLKRLLKTFKINDEIEIILNFDEAVNKCALSQEVKLNLYRILQEQLKNIFKHAKANVVEVDVVIDCDKLTLKISDNGIGFDTNAIKG